jgi:hypothetical protein
MNKIHRAMAAITAVVAVLAVSTTLRASPTQADVFKSISDNMSQKSDPGQFLGVMAAIAGAAILFALFTKRRERVVRPKTLNHQKKLMKEVMRATSLRPAEVRLLKSLAESQAVDYSLVLMLCPSILEKALREKNGKLERKVAIQLARKAGLIPVRAKKVSSLAQP